MMLEILNKYFPDLTLSQTEKLCRLKVVYEEWNSKINVISRKDFENFDIHHVLHSLSVAKVTVFLPGTRVLDIGTGGGFPGIPLSILFPRAEFVLLDSTGKKIKVVTEVSRKLDLQNVVPVCERAENHKGKYDFIISRAVAPFPELVKLARGKNKKECFNMFRNGIIALKGGDLTGELKNFLAEITLFPISRFFDEPFFKAKFVVYMPFDK